MPVQKKKSGKLLIAPRKLGSASLFNGISTFMGSLIQKPTFLKDYGSIFCLFPSV